MKQNKVIKPEKVYTHEGARARKETPLLQLRRTLSSCMLFEDTFYEGGDSIAYRLAELAQKVTAENLMAETIAAKNTGLRHAPLWMAVQYAHLYKGSTVSQLILEVVRRVDELGEFLKLYWYDGKCPISKQVKLGLAAAFNKFDEYQFAKYRKGEISLRDVMFLVHPKAGERQELYKKIAEDQLATPDTWEVALSGGADKKSTWERLLREEKLGGLALIRNLRNMAEVQVERSLVKEAIEKANFRGILPFQLVQAWDIAPDFSGALSKKVQSLAAQKTTMSGNTMIVVDISGSMNGAISIKSQISRWKAAGALAVELVNRSVDAQVFTFSDSVVQLPLSYDFGLIEAIDNSQPHCSTYLGGALAAIPARCYQDAERLVVITDEQTHDAIPEIKVEKKYMINVAPYEYGVVLDNSWVRINGFSAATIDWIYQEEKSPLFLEKEEEMAEDD